MMVSNFHGDGVVFSRLMAGFILPCMDGRAYQYVRYYQHGLDGAQIRGGASVSVSVSGLVSVSFFVFLPFYFFFLFSRRFCPVSPSLHLAFGCMEFFSVIIDGPRRHISRTQVGREHNNIEQLLL